MEEQYDLSVIVPCYNEEGNIGILVQRILAVFAKYDIHAELLLVNDGSSDETANYIDKAQSEHESVRAYHHEINQGMEQGWNTGLQFARGNYSCFIDADLQYLPEEIYRLYKTIKAERCDVVQGARSTIGRLKDSRYILSVGLNIMLNILFGMRSKDNKSGFVMAPTDVLKDIMAHKFHYYYYQTFITVAAKSKGYLIQEVETLFGNRFFGTSFIAGFPGRLIFRTVVDVIKGFCEFRLLARYRTGSVVGILNQYAPSTKIIPTHYQKGIGEKLRQIMYFSTFPLHKWKITSKAKTFYSILQRTQWLDKESIQNLQLGKLKRLIHHAYIHVPYYRECMKKQNLTPDDINSLEDIAKLPLLSKDHVRENLYFDLFSDTHNKKEMLQISTSGSTGKPFVTFVDHTQLEMRLATTLRSMEWTGWHLGKKQMRLWHQTIGMNTSQIIREKLDAWLMKRRFIPAFEMSDTKTEQLIKEIKSYKPYLLDGYAESFNMIANYIKNHDIKGVSVPAIMSSAQTLTEETRHIIEETFNTKVYDKYGSREFSGIAYECQAHDGYHVMAESYIVEVLKDGKPAKAGEIGEVVITDLNNFSVPMIRYRIGDLAVKKSEDHLCSCGRHLPMLEKIEGRVKSVITFADGNWLPGTFFSHLFKDYHYAVKQYQIIQHLDDRLEVKLVCYNESQKIDRELREKLYEYIPQSVEIYFTYTDHIPLTKTGKHLAVINKNNLDFQDIDSSLAS